mmetsp:Transcript_5876/g.8062  ORF Transcript_5876/g.8062 Transcript_5876/m.8062 type:complete len:549 (+) Transcript_5876:78-1724(+)
MADLRQSNISLMNDLQGFDVVIVCTGNEMQASYWQKKLEDARGKIMASDVKVIAVHEDWEGGAGNALGTLYAFQNACEAASSLHSIDLLAQLNAATVSVALYHTAGKGTRMAPLPGAEANNKPGVKLASPLGDRSLTILEAVIKQTGVYAGSRKGRLSVFWGDQVFIPCATTSYNPASHADILCKLIPMPSETEWSEKGLEKYGLIAVNEAGNAAQVEKVSYSTAVDMLAGMGEIKQIGTSLGSFSVSHQLLSALLEEFNPELEKKEGKMDSDPHLWMPMTLTKESYCQLMTSKGISEEECAAHYDRIKGMMDKFEANEMGILGAVDIGADSYWWDYGQLKLYFANNMLLKEGSEEANLYRSFLGISERVAGSSINDAVVDEASSIIQISTLGSGNVSSSVLAGVTTPQISAEGCLLVDVVAKSVTAAPGSLAYNVILEDQDLVLGEGDIVAGVLTTDGKQILMKSNNQTDGGKAWKIKLEMNEYSFEEIYKMNGNIDVNEIEVTRSTKVIEAKNRVINTNGKRQHEDDGDAKDPEEKKSRQEETKES